MSLGIPLPGSFGQAFGQGVDTGSTLISRMLQPKLQRESDSRQWAQHQQSLAQQQEQLKQQWEQHLNNLAIQQAQEQRLAQRAPYEIQELQARMGHHNAQTKGLQFDQNLLQQLLNHRRMGQNGNVLPTLPAPNMPGSEGAPRSQFNPPPGMEGQLNQTNNVQNPEFDPIAAGLIKNRLGIDVNAESPGMKSQRDVQTSGQKERSKLNEQFRASNLEGLEAAQDSLADLQQAKDLLGVAPIPGTPRTPENEQYDYATSALGYVDSKLPALRPGTRKFRGEFERLAGRMKSNIARLEKGATSDKERAMIDKAEITDSDSWTTASGKLIAQEKYLKRLIERKSKMAELIELGYPRDQAIKISMKETPIVNEKSNPSENNESGDFKGIINGKQVSIHPSRRKQFEEKGGKIL